MKDFISKIFSREFIILVMLEVYLMIMKGDLILDTNNIILVTSLLGLTTMKKYIDSKTGKTIEIESNVKQTNVTSKSDVRLDE